LKFYVANWGEFGYEENRRSASLRRRIHSPVGETEIMAAKALKFDKSHGLRVARRNGRLIVVVDLLLIPFEGAAEPAR
jgi:hypothetical protein